MEDPPILFSVEDQVGKIHLNRPSVYNSFNREMALSLQEVLKQCKEDETVRSILLSGMGKAFCAGQDINELQAEDAPSLSNILTDHFNPVIMLIVNMDKPIIAAVNGVAAGAGANLALACDITIAAESASFIQAFCKIGLIPDSGGTFLLPRLVGWQRATALMMLGEAVSAKEAVNMGMIYKSYPNKSFNKEANAMAKKLAQMPTKALGLIKQALSYSYNSSIDKQLSIETELQSKASRTNDFKEGIQAFLEKRQAAFKGE